MKGYYQSLSAVALLAGSTHSALANDDFNPFFEILVMGGTVSLDAEDTSLQITEWETDKLTQANEGDWKSWTGQIGVGYVYPLAEDLETGDVQWFPLINPQLNVYYLDGDGIHGDVHQFESAEFDTLDYKMDYRSTRLMYDVGITVAAIDKFSIYAIGGAGIAWNQVEFKAKPNAFGLECGTEGFELDTENSTSFAYEFGGGMTYAILDDVAISVEYLYTGFKDVKIGDDTDSDFDIESDDLDVNSQSILLGLRFAI